MGVINNEKQGLAIVTSGRPIAPKLQRLTKLADKRLCTLLRIKKGKKKEIKPSTEALQGIPSTHSSEGPKDEPGNILSSKVTPSSNHCFSPYIEPPNISNLEDLVEDVGTPTAESTASRLPLPNTSKRNIEIQVTQVYGKELPCISQYGSSKQESTQTAIFIGKECRHIQQKTDEPRFDNIKENKIYDSPRDCSNPILENAQEKGNLNEIFLTQELSKNQFSLNSKHETQSSTIASLRDYPAKQYVGIEGQHAIRPEISSESTEVLLPFTVNSFDEKSEHHDTPLINRPNNLPPSLLADKESRCHSRPTKYRFVVNPSTYEIEGIISSRALGFATIISSYPEDSVYSTRQSCQAEVLTSSRKRFNPHNRLFHCSEEIIRDVRKLEGARTRYTNREEPNVLPNFPYKDSSELEINVREPSTQIKVSVSEEFQRELVSSPLEKKDTSNTMLSRIQGSSQKNDSIRFFCEKPKLKCGATPSELNHDWSMRCESGRKIAPFPNPLGILNPKYKETSLSRQESYCASKGSLISEKIIDGFLFNNPFQTFQTEITKQIQKSPRCKKRKCDPYCNHFLNDRVEIRRFDPAASSDSYEYSSPEMAATDTLWHMVNKRTDIFRETKHQNIYRDELHTQEYNSYRSMQEISPDYDKKIPDINSNGPQESTYNLPRSDLLYIAKRTGTILNERYLTNKESEDSLFSASLPYNHSQDVQDPTNEHKCQNISFFQNGHRIHALNRIDKFCRNLYLSKPLKKGSCLCIE